MTEQRRTLVAMSGGVDSSVAAALLREQGHELVGVTLHLWDASGEQKVGRCCAPEDREDARISCDALGVPHYVIDERAAFRSEVVDPFVRDYAAGRTPSPCVACNQHVKLGRLAELADAFGCSSIATGHYARIEADPQGGVRLLRGADRGKDQSYFLHGVPTAILSRMVLPLGHLQKDETRLEGKRLGVPNWDKKDSQELCFVPDGDVGSFVDREKRTKGEDPSELHGDMVDEDGRVLAPHGGVHRFTIGQRKGLGLGGGPSRYVLRIIAETHQVVVGPDEALGQSQLQARAALWVASPPAERFRAEVQVRYRHQAALAWVEATHDGFVAHFDEPQRAIAPGQAAVIYDGQRVLGGGMIAAAS